MMKPQKGKHLFGMVTVGSKGQIVIPKRARDVFHIEPGDSLVLVGDEAQGLAIITNTQVSKLLQGLLNGDDAYESDPND